MHCTTQVVFVASIEVITIRIVSHYLCGLVLHLLLVTTNLVAEDPLQLLLIQLSLQPATGCKDHLVRCNWWACAQLLCG